MKRVLILGATGTFGTALVKRLSQDKELTLTLASRHAADVYAGNAWKAVNCDATSIADLRAAAEGCDTVYCAVSGGQLPDAARAIVSVMNELVIRRLILMGAVGIYDEIPADMDDKDNVRNNLDQVPNREAADIAEASGLDYTILRPGYLRDGEADDFVLTFKGEQAKGYISTIPSVVELAVRLIKDDSLYAGQSVSITRDMTAASH